MSASNGDGTAAGPPPLVSALLDGLDFVARWIVILAMAGMVGLVALQVFLRYGLSSSVMGSDELARLCFVWAVFLAIPLGVRAKRHVVVNILPPKLPLPLRRKLGRAVSAATAGILALAGWQAARVAVSNWDELLPTVDLSAGFFFVAASAGCLHAALHFLAMAIFGEPAPLGAEAIAEAEAPS